MEWAFVLVVLSPIFYAHPLSKSWLSGQMSDSFLLYHNTTGFALHGIVLAGCSTASVGETISHYKKYLHKANAALPTFPGWRGWCSFCLALGFLYGYLKEICKVIFLWVELLSMSAIRREAWVLQVVPGVALTRIAMVSF